VDFQWEIPLCFGFHMVRFPESSQESTSVRDRFSPKTNFVVSSMEYWCCLFDVCNIMGKYQQKNVWLFVAAMSVASPPVFEFQNAQNK